VACNNPITGNRDSDGVIRERRGMGSNSWQVTIACGQCRACRLERSRQWAVRIMHEAQAYEPEQCHFITLTYADEHLPELGSLVVRDWQDFARRARTQIGKFRYFHCGEYGDRYGRPHYHACTFGLELNDLVPAGKTKSGEQGYDSETLTHVWGKGKTQIGSLTFESAAYTARYIMKKVNGEKRKEGHYEITDQKTGEVKGEKKPEYTTMSRRPGIGKEWIKKYKEDVYPRDEVIMNGKKMRPPKFYDGHYELEDPGAHQQLKAKRAMKAKKRNKDQTPERLDTKEEILRLKALRFERDF